MFRQFALASTFLLPLPAMAQVMTGADTDAIMNLVSGFGSVELETDAQGDPLMTGRIDGVRYGILFYNCESDRGCTSIQFISLFDNVGPNTLALMNQWNEERRFGTAFMQTDGDIVLNYSLNLDHGVTPRNFEDSVALWASALPDFADFITQ